MPAELGETNDPTALIPGDPESIYTTFGGMVEYAALLEEAGKGLTSIDTSSGWSGPAADAFRAKYKTQPQKWLQAGDAFRTAASALSNYADMLSWAQQAAADAINTWNSGKQNHQAATEMLASARSQLASTASTAAAQITNAAKAFPGAPGFWSQALSDLDGAWHDVEHAAETVLADTVNGVASFGNAAINDPGGMAATIGGLALAGVSTLGEGAGVVLDATGVGAIGGVPLNIASTAGIATGLTIAGAGVTSIALDAAGPDKVTVMQASSSGGSGGGGGEPADDSGSQTVNQVLKNRLGSIRRAPLPKGSPSWNDIGDMTMDEVRAAANSNQTGFKTILKLLNDNRFAKS
jgi:hypothetical protein